MCRIIDRLANEKGFIPEDANFVFTFVTERLINKVPALKQIIKNVFEELEDDKLKEDISKLAMTQQQQHAERFKNWRMPDGVTIRQSGCKYIL
jgi:hypothetical protein